MKRNQDKIYTHYTQIIKGVDYMNLLACCSRRGGVVNRFYSYTSDSLRHVSQKVSQLSQEVFSEVSTRYGQAKDAIFYYSQLAVDRGLAMAQNLNLYGERVYRQANQQMNRVVQDLAERNVILESAKRQGLADIALYKTLALVSIVAFAVFTLSAASAFALCAPIALPLTCLVGCIGSVIAVHETTKIHKNLSGYLETSSFVVKTLIQKRSALYDPKIIYEGTLLSYIPSVKEIKRLFGA